ncbi:adenylate/guanylate cyclase domain-containing protein [Pseudahrensia aquimaris]|uniref:Adenylate/guanylate cyclase domain-containing protein n=1 Tax=Pseudahrensia aquimaris TaxID=744461 RepID=A0ABW3FI44_9HYPH
MSVQTKSLERILTQHGLEAYVEVLTLRGINSDNLHLITFEDLRELKISANECRRLMTAASKSAIEASSGHPAGELQTQPTERRHLTILFCDLVDSTRLSLRLDPEELNDVIQIYAERTKTEINRFGGHVLRVMGDGVLALFGYPVAHEDDAERAVLAAIGCRTACSATPIRTESGEAIEIEVRIGLHTGLVVVGSFDPMQGVDIVGAAPNVAQRMQSAAAPGEILISPETRKLAGDRFEYEVLEPKQLKGLSEPVTPFRVRKELNKKTRFEARSHGALAPLIGRNNEVAQLLEVWETVKGGAGRSGLISGPAGIGKSRLWNVFSEAIQTEKKNVTVFQCSPHHTGTPLYPVVTRISQEVDLLSASNGTNRHDAVSAWLQQGMQTDPKSIALLSALLSIDTSEQAVQLDMSPRQQSEETMLLLVNYAMATAQKQPSLLLFEDIHWADPSTIRLIELYLQNCQAGALMVLSTVRSEFDYGPPPDGFDRIFNLGLLEDHEAVDLVRHVAYPHEIAAKTVQAIVERGEGIPLFIEELAKSALKSPIGSKIHLRDVTKSNQLVPDSLVDSLSARLDALPSAKHLAQIAAAIGREVSQDLLRSVSGYSPAEFRLAVIELVEARILRSLPQQDSEPLIFGHALIQDVAYQLMLRQDRRSVHSKVVTVLERDFPAICNQFPEVLARHCEESNQIEKAVRFLLDAGTRAISRSANVEALQHLKHARDLIAQSTTIPKQRLLELELDIENTIGTPLILVEGYTSKETIRSFERAEQVAIDLGEDQARFHALFGLWGHRWMAGHIKLSQRIAKQMLVISEKELVPEREILAHRSAGSSFWITGEFDKMRRHFEVIKSLTDNMDTKHLADRYAVCPRVVAQALGGYAMCLRGENAGGHEEISCGLTRSYEMNHSYSKALSHSMMGGVKLLANDFEGLAEHCDALRSIAEERRFSYWLTYAQIFEGALDAEQGKLDEGYEKIVQSIETYDAMGVRIHRTMQLVMLSDIEVRRRKYHAATKNLDRAWAVGKRTGERQWFPMIERKRAKISGLEKETTVTEHY